MSKSKILIAEDDSMLRSLLRFRLERADYIIEEAPDGKAAIEAITTFQPDLIISDIMMPFMNGLEIINHVRNEMKLEVPIIILSMAGQEENVLEAFNIGANDFIAKPFNPNELVVRCKRLLR